MNISSVSGLVGGHNLAAYNASKGGVRLLVQIGRAARRAAEPQVRCNSVHPTFLEGPMTDALLKPAREPGRDERAKMTRDIPLRRFGKPAEVADMCVYLLVRRVRLRHRRGIRDRRRADGAIGADNASQHGSSGCPGIRS